MEYKLSNFQGPLDLLLYMLSKNKLKIEDIFISDIVNQFIEITKNSDDTNLDDIGDFVLMSSKLIYIKSQRLIASDSEEIFEFEQDLIERLEEYQKIKEISNILSENYDFGINYICKTSEIFENEENYNHDLEELFECAREIMSRGIEKLPPKKSDFEKIIMPYEISVEEFSLKILEYIKETNSFLDIISYCTSKIEIIVAFLSILDLCRQQKIKLAQKDEDIILEEVV